MNLLKTGEFEKDVKKLDKPLREQLKKAIQKICENPESGKPLKHLKSVFSERVSSHRLIYRLQPNGILLVCFKNRDGVYEYLKG